MASQSEENLCCPVCHDIFKDPVLLACSHTFCKACWQRWWTERRTHQCPVCKTKSLLYDPPQNLVAKNLCEALLAARDKRRSGDICGVHSEELKLFCVDHQLPVCVICLHSHSHNNHSFRPIDEAAKDYKEALRLLLKPLQEKLELFNDVKRNFDQTAENILVQARDAERQINDEVSMLKKCLEKEQQARIRAIKKEEKQKSQTMKRKIEALSREIAALSDTVRTTEEVLRAGDLSFLHGFKAAAGRVDGFQLNDPQPSPVDLIDTAKHLNNLPFVILDSVKKTIPTSVAQGPKTNPDPPLFYPQTLETSVRSITLQREAASTGPLCVATATRKEPQGLSVPDNKLFPPFPLLKSLNKTKMTSVNYTYDDLFG